MAESAAVEFRIDRRSGVATYLQIVQQTKQALRLGVLEPGDRLPTAREVVEATAINPNTVLKAYRELEREGLVEARRGLGTFVRRTLGGAAGASAADSPLRTELADWARRARSAGLEKDDVGALFTAVLESTYESARGDGPYGGGPYEGAYGGAHGEGTSEGTRGTTTPTSTTHQGDQDR
ncbi:GntR family transcriptional regulator [Streptomyces sp. CYG20]|nr:GntR family transcriptional regulator [Streptomyces sp. COG21]MBT3078778.1 GntR family transcriptional regulator [Streptomyces sp. COG20]MBT3089765.1 GntR family transcriptional regulator [Streptomyces sp. CYG21]MBT3095754.1 GntR family transcriptional regulator [Streptomyces sp. CBG30]MBT3107357.1 GntR family transcriptional regulator [Streptomyces sp. COG19]MBT3111666.1 GntR family transcriptional regulator [Streptomyces sp. CYG20]